MSYYFSNVRVEAELLWGLIHTAESTTGGWGLKVSKEPRGSMIRTTLFMKTFRAEFEMENSLEGVCFNYSECFLAKMRTEIVMVQQG